MRITGRGMSHHGVASVGDRTGVTCDLRARRERVDALRRVGRRDGCDSQLRARGQAQPLTFGVIHTGLGDIDAAFAWLATAYRLRDGSLFWLAEAPGLDPLHVDPRFGDLVCRLGVAPA
jgi:hypothetical protein